MAMIEIQIVMAQDETVTEGLAIIAASDVAHIDEALFVLACRKALLIAGGAFKPQKPAPDAGHRTAPVIL